MRFGDLEAALKARDVLQAMMDNTVLRLRPEPRIGMVRDFERASRRANVLFPGDPIDNALEVKFYKSVQPYRAMADETDEYGTPIGTGDIVRVVGKAGNYYISQILEGDPYVDVIGPVFPGFVTMSAAPVEPPGWLLLDDNVRLVFRSEYSRLFKAIGEMYSAGDGETTFGLPPAGDRFPIAATSGTPLGSQGGSWTTDVNRTHVPPHIHSMGHGHTSRGRESGPGPQGNNLMQAGGVGAINTDNTAVNSYSGDTGDGSSQGLGQTPLPVINPYHAFNFLIKT